MAGKEVVTPPRECPLLTIRLSSIPPRSQEVLVTGGEIVVATTSPSTQLQLASTATPTMLTSPPITSCDPLLTPALLEKFTRQLDNNLVEAANVVSAGRAPFELYKSFLMNDLNNLRCMGETERVQHYSEKISRLEESLQSLRDWEYGGLSMEKKRAIAGIQAEMAYQRELAQKNLIDREAYVASLQGEYAQAQSALAASLDKMRASHEVITRLREELSQREVQFAQEEATVKGLTLRHAEISAAYGNEAQVLDQLKQEIATLTPSEEDIQQQAEGVARLRYEEKLSELRAHLSSVVQGSGPQT